MAQPPYRLLALDVDGTLLDPEHQLRPATAAAVRDCLAAGITVTLATGRLLGAIRAFCRELDLHGPQVVCNGAIVADVDDGRILATSLLSDEQVATVETQLQSFGLPYCLFSLDSIYVLPGGARGVEALREYGEPEPTSVPQLRSAYVPYMTKLLSISRDPSHDRELRNLLRGIVSVVRTHPIFLEFLALDASKGHGVAMLASQLGIPLAQVAVIGDSFNDLSMFAIAGLSVAMGQAPDEVKAHAHQISADNAHDGAALAMRTFLLGKT